jgi:uncharacterized glyoxalase superfamily protein PhnB
MNAYGAVLKFCLRFKIIPVAIAVALMVFCAREVMNIGLVMLPDMGGMQMSMTMTAPEDTDRDTAYAEAMAKGARPILEPTTEPWGQRTCYIADPEGNLIEIGSFNQSF